MDKFNQNLENLLKNASTVVEYFLVIGINTNNDHQSMEEKLLSPTILFQFPQFSRIEAQIPESISLFCFPWGVIPSIIFNPAKIFYQQLTDEKGNKLYCTLLRVWEFKEESVDSTDSTVESKRSSHNSEGFYLPKCLAIVSRLAFFDTFNKILQKIYSLCTEKVTIPMEWYIAHLVSSIPAPPRGHYKILYRIHAEDFCFKLPPLNKIPLLDINLEYLFESLSIENILKVFTCLVLEYSVVFLSSDDFKLSACSLCLMSFLFPFQWSLVYVPVLPEALIEYLYSPVNYVYGLKSQIKEEVYLRGSESLFVVELDSGIVQNNAQATNISNESSAPITLPQLPAHYRKKLVKRLENILGEGFRRSGGYYDQKTCESIREAFFQFMVSIFKNYKKYMNFVHDKDNCENFNEQGFLKSQPESSRPFFQQFFKTQMFANFCEKCVRPQNIEEHSEILLFDEQILAKANRSKLRYNKHQTPFINDETQACCIDWPVEEMKVEPSPLSSPISYQFFPDLSAEILKMYPVKNEPIPKFSESVEFPISNHSVSITESLSNEELIINCWIEMWAACLWYQDEREHNLRLKELLTVLERLKNKSKNSLTPLYKVLLEASARINPSLGIPIFSEMTTSKVMVDAATIHLLQRIISLSFKKDQKHVVNTGKSIFYTSMTYFENFGANNYKRRVFTKVGDSHIFAKQELCFLIKETCAKCNKSLDVKEIRKCWNSEPYKFELMCLTCKELFLPYLWVRVGLEVGHDSKTSNKENTIFVSPLAVKAMISDLLKEGKNKFKLEIELFRVYNSLIFWNLIWHFNDLGLPFEFMLPYEEEAEDVKSSFIVVEEEKKRKTIRKAENKEVQTDWNLVNIDQAIKKYNEMKKSDA